MTIQFTIEANHLVGTEGPLYLGRERLATDPGDRDLTGTLRMFGLGTAIAPGEWPIRGAARGQLDGYMAMNKFGNRYADR